MNHRSVIALVTSGMLLAAAAPAQTPMARVSGNALDQVGGLLPYVKVGLTNRRTMAHHEARTDQAGHFEIEGVAPGDYVIQAERAGFTNAQESLSLGPGEHLHHEITLSVAPFEEHMVVDGDAERDPGAKFQAAAVPPKCEPSAIGGDGTCHLQGAPRLSATPSSWHQHRRHRRASPPTVCWRRCALAHAVAAAAIA